MRQAPLGLFGLALFCVVLILGGDAGAQEKKKSNPKVNPQLVANCEQFLIGFGCKLHRDEKAPGAPVDIVWFPPKTRDVDLKQLFVHAKELPGLQTLDLGETKITDRGLKELAGVPQVQSVLLDHTAVTDAGMKDLTRIPGLKWFDLTYTSVTTAGIKELAGMRFLQGLHIGNSALEPRLEIRPKITAEVVSVVSGFKQLRSVDLQGTQAGGRSLEPLSACDRLVELKCNGFFSGISKLTRLKVLDLGAGSAASGIGALSDLPDLRELRVGAPLGKADVAKEIGSLKQLQKLDLSHKSHLAKDAGKADLEKYAKGWEICLTPLSNLVGLRELKLRHSVLTAASLKHLAALKDLEKLDLIDSQLTDDGLKPLAGLTSLKLLLLMENKVTANGVARLQQALPRCVIYYQYTGGSNWNWRVPNLGAGGTRQ